MLPAQHTDPSLVEMRLLRIIEDLRMTLGQVVSTITQHLPSTHGSLDHLSRQLFNTPSVATPINSSMSDEGALLLGGYGDLAMTYRRVKMAMHPELTLEDVNLELQQFMPKQYGSKDPAMVRQLLWHLLGYYDGHKRTEWWALHKFAIENLDITPILADAAILPKDIPLIPSSFENRASGLYRISAYNTEQLLLYARLAKGVMFFYNGHNHSMHLWLYVDIERRWVQSSSLDYVDWDALLVVVEDCIQSRCTWPSAVTLQQLSEQLLKALEEHPLPNTSTEDWLYAVHGPVPRYNYGNRSRYDEWNSIYRVIESDDNDYGLPTGTRQLVLRIDNGRLFFNYQPDGVVTHWIEPDPREQNFKPSEYNVSTCPVRAWEDLPLVNMLTWPAMLVRGIKYTSEREAEREREAAAGNDID